MKKETWWNRPMTRKNWAVLIALSISIGLAEAGYLLYAESIKRFIKGVNKTSFEMFQNVKERF